MSNRRSPGEALLEVCPYLRQWLNTYGACASSMLGLHLQFTAGNDMGVELLVAYFVLMITLGQAMTVTWQITHPDVVDNLTLVEGDFDEATERSLHRYDDRLDTRLVRFE